jgi:hypothetical protein
MKTSHNIRRLGMVAVAVLLLGCCSFAWQAVNPRKSDGNARVQRAALPLSAGRQYGWNQLKAILSPDGAQATWETWSSKCNLADDIAAAYPAWRMNLTQNCASLHNTAFPDRSLRAALATASLTPQTAGDVFRPASVFLNGVAVRSINDNNWNLPASGTSAADRLVPGAAAPLQVTFQPDSIIVKAIWEVVNSENSTWPLRVYDLSQPQWNQGTGITPPRSFIRVEGWKTLVHLDINENTQCPYRAGSPSSNIPLDSTIPISCFTYHRVTKEMYDVSMLGNTAGQWQGTYPFYLVLVGLSVSTRDNNGWNFTTFWWTNDPDADPNHTSQPAGNLPFKYTQFAMDTSEDSYPVQNPYLEGPEGRTGMSSDCADCHKLAEVRVDPMTGAVIKSQSNLGLPLSTLPPNYNQHRTLTDSVWTLATARDGGPVP